MFKEAEDHDVQMEISPTELAKQSVFGFAPRDIDYVFRYSPLTRNVALQWYRKDATTYELVDPENPDEYKKMIPLRDSSVPIFDILAILLMLRPSVLGVESVPIKVDTKDLEGFKFEKTDEETPFVMPWIKDGLKQPELIRHRLDINTNLKFLYEYSLRKADEKSMMPQCNFDGLDEEYAESEVKNNEALLKNPIMTAELPFKFSSEGFLQKQKKVEEQELPAN
jgi:hypothetical protein